jgi:hypothetical protein
VHESGRRWKAELGSALRGGQCAGWLLHDATGRRGWVFLTAAPQAHGRGVYRFVHFPASDHEELAVVWLWSDREGVFSHQTALALHGLSDVLPGQIHLTLPAEWRRRRFRVPEGVVLHHAAVPPEDRVWFGPVPVTSPLRTLRDCATEAVSPELLRQAARQAIRRGLVVNGELPEVEKALRPFGGIAT